MPPSRKRPKRQSPKRKSPKRKSPRRSPKRKSPKRKSPKRKSPKRKSPRRSPKRKRPRRSPMRKSPKRKSPKRRSPKRGGGHRHKSPRRSPKRSPKRTRRSPRKRRAAGSNPTSLRSLQAQYGNRVSSPRRFTKPLLATLGSLGLLGAAGTTYVVRRRRTKDRKDDSSGSRNDGLREITERIKSNSKGEVTEVKEVAGTTSAVPVKAIPIKIDENTTVFIDPGIWKGLKADTGFSKEKVAGVLRAMMQPRLYKSPKMLQRPRLLEHHAKK